MTGRAHMVIGLSAGILGAAHTAADNPFRMAIVLVVVVAALLPDIDHPKAIVSGYLPCVGHAARLVVSHRGATHTLLFAAAIVALLFALNAPVPIMLGAASGILTHLIADMTTPQGVPLLMPLSRRKFRIAPYPVLNLLAWILEAIATVGALVLIGLVVSGKV